MLHALRPGASSLFVRNTFHTGDLTAAQMLDKKHLTKTQNSSYTITMEEYTSADVRCAQRRRVYGAAFRQLVLRQFRYGVRPITRDLELLCTSCTIITGRFPGLKFIASAGLPRLSSSDNRTVRKMYWQQSFKPVSEHIR